MDILLIEDNPDDTEFASRALRRSGFTGSLTSVDDAEKALVHLVERAEDPARPGLPRLILLDVKMPRMGGLEALAALKADARLRAIPVVVFTSSRESSDIGAAYGAGANSYIVKPVNFDDHQAALAEIVSYWTRVNLAPAISGPGD